MQTIEEKVTQILRGVFAGTERSIFEPDYNTLYIISTQTYFGKKIKLLSFF